MCVSLCHAPGVQSLNAMTVVSLQKRTIQRLVGLQHLEVETRSIRRAFVQSGIKQSQTSPGMGQGEPSGHSRDALARSWCVGVQVAVLVPTSHALVLFIPRNVNV